MSTCENSKIYNNTAGRYGGGMYGKQASYCHIKGNAAELGGATCDDVSGGPGDSMWLSSCVVEENTASTEGSGIYVTNRTNIYNCTIVNNIGCGVYVNGHATSYEPYFEGFSINCVNSIIYGNSSGQLTGYYRCDQSDYNCSSETYVPEDYNLIGGNPGFVNYNDGDYHLAPTSLCIDEGLNSSVSLRLDMDHNIRIVDGDDDSEATVDFGAYEYDDYRHYEFDETQGSTADDSDTGNPYDGTLIGGPVWQSDQGVFGGALCFDGVDDYVVVDDPNYYGISGTHARTVSLWFKTQVAKWSSGGTMPYDMTLVQWGHDENIGQLWKIYLRPGRTVAVSAAGGGVETTKTYNDGLWHHVVVVLEEGETSSANIQLYVDGKSDSVQFSDAVDINTNTANMPVHIGAQCWYNNGNPTYGNYFLGLIDDVRIYKGVWTDVDQYDTTMVTYQYQKAKSAQLRGETTIYYDLDEVPFDWVLTNECWAGGSYGVIYGAAESSGVFSGALSFDGIDDYVKIPGYNGVSGVHARSVSVWFKTSTSAWTSVMNPALYILPLVQWGHNENAGQLWMVYLRSDRKVAVAVASGGVYSDTSFNDGQWHNIVAVLEEGVTNPRNIKLYVDGQLNAIPYEGSAYEGTMINTNTLDMPVHIGTRCWYNDGNSHRDNYFQGLMDEVRIYDQALSEGDVQILYSEF